MNFYLQQLHFKAALVKSFIHIHTSVISLYLKTSFELVYPNTTGACTEQKLIIAEIQLSNTDVTVSFIHSFLPIFVISGCDSGVFNDVFVPWILNKNSQISFFK